MTAVIVGGDGSFSPTGERLTGPVDSVDKLEKLIDWARKHNLLPPLGSAAGDTGDSVPARIWVVGGGCQGLLGAVRTESGDVTEQLSESLAPLIGRGWELRRGVGSAVVLSRGVGPQRFSVEVIAEAQPWLAGAGGAVDDVAELGRRLRRWYGALGTLPAVSGAASGAAVQDHLMRARVGRRGAVVTEPGVLPSHVVPDVRIQPSWCAPAAELESEFERCEELVWLAQECPRLASAGTLTFGHGSPKRLEGSSAVQAAQAPKKPFGLWRVVLPPLSAMQMPEMLPPPHPQMSAAHSVQAWVSTEDLSGLASEVRDGGAGLSLEQLGVDEAIVWPQQSRLLEAWAGRLRQAREEFADDAPMRALVESAAADYLEALGDPGPWSEEAWRHHFQPAWAVAIAARVRLRGRRAAMRISREYRVWPVYAHDAAMIYLLGRDEVTTAPIELSDTHSRLGRMIVIRRAEVTDDIILDVLKAQSSAEVADALTRALDMPADEQPVAVAPTKQTVDSSAAAVTADEPSAERDSDSVETQDISPTPSAADEDRQPSRKSGRKRHAPTSAAVTGGSPAAVLQTDGLWLADGTHIELDAPIVHVGQVAQLAYTHNIGYQISAKFAEPGQIWVTEQACLAFGIDVAAISRRDRAKSLRQLTEGLDFVTLAVAEGWNMGGAGEDPNAHRLGSWTRVYREDKRGVMIALIPGMGAGPDEMPILADEPSPAQLARRLKLLADALRFPWKINAGVTAVDLMLQTRTKTWSPKEWKDVVFAPSTAEVPYGIGDVESDFDWSRAPTGEESRRRYVHAYDRGGSYVAGIAGLELPIGAPVHHPDGAPFDAATPGYWLTEIPESSDWRLPYVLNPRGLAFTNAKWVCTPTLERAIALGYQPTIQQAWLWPQHGRVLIGWYERFRDAGTSLDVDDADAQAARNQAKIIRTHGVGIIGSAEHLKGKPAYSPERRLHVVAKAKANIVYRLHQIGEKTGHWPVAVATDTVLYASDDPNPLTAWPGGPETLGRGFGQYKPEGSALLADHIGHLNGRDYRGRQDLIPTAQWCAQLPTIDDDESS
jgi:hypothetical protein